MPESVKTPAHLDASTRKWFESVVADRVVEDHHLKVLTCACEAWMRKEAARKALAEHGLVYTDRFGCPRARPEVAMVRDAETSFLRAVRELGLDDGDSPEAPRPPRPTGRYRKDR